MTHLVLEEVEKTKLNRSDALRFFREHHDTINILLRLPKAAFDDPSASFYQAVVEDNVVGYCGYKKLTEKLAMTQKMVVHKDHRGQGYARIMSGIIEGMLKEKGFTKLVTHIYTKNFPMLFLRLKQGWLVEGLHMDHDAPGLHEYTLGKSLIFLTEITS